MWFKRSDLEKALAEKLSFRTKENIELKHRIIQLQESMDEMGEEFKKTSECLYKTEELRRNELDILNRTGDELEKARKELKNAIELLNPDVIRAAKYLNGNIDKHPTGCCLICSKGLADRDGYRKAAYKAIEDIEEGFYEEAIDVLSHAVKMEDNK